MATANPKIFLSRSRDIPFNKLVLSQANVRRVKAGISIEDLAEDIANRTLLQSLCVRPVCDAEGVETDMFEVPAGGRRYRALELLVRQKRMAKTQPVPCVIRTDGLAEEDSLAENVQRAALHPLDQFRAFQSLRAKGLGEEEIAARFFVSGSVVKQRLRLASVSPRLLEAYGEDEMTLEQLMAFTVTDDHAHQEQVWEAIGLSYNNQPHFIRRQLTEGAVRASDKRGPFVGVAAYEEAGGIVVRDLFEQDDGGWLKDPALLNRLADEKLQHEAEAVRAEGWKWVEVAVEFPYGYTAGLRQVASEPAALTELEQREFDALREEYDALETEHAHADELDDKIEQRLGEIEAALDVFEAKPRIYDPAERARAGAFVSIYSDGRLRVDRGYVRPEDEPHDKANPAEQADSPEGATVTDTPARDVTTTSGDETAKAVEPADDEDGIRPLPDRLVMELTAHRTLALRDALASNPHVAFLATLHALCLQTFYGDDADTCLEIKTRSPSFPVQAPGLNDAAPARSIDARHAAWTKRLPREACQLWRALTGCDPDTRTALFAHCVSLSVNGVHEPWGRRAGAMAHADHLAQALTLDMVAAGFRPTVENYLGRVTKARIREAVHEAKGEGASQLIDHLRKPDMAREAERMLADTGWLPEPLRTPADAATAGTAGDGSELPAFLGEDMPREPDTDRLAAE
jgi:ParB family chromosome partitioning protein